MPSPAALLFIATAFLVCITNGDALLNSDGDLARHLRVGTYILQTHSIPQVDLFSHTMLGRPFLAYEWLSEMLYAGAHQIAGLPGVTVFAALIIATMAALTYAFMARRGVDPLLAVLVTAPAVILTSLHWLARPHLFTMLGAILVLCLAESRGRRAILWSMPLFMLWANLHGGFTFGLVVIGLYLVADLGTYWVSDDSAAARERMRYHGMLLAASTVATVVTPAGLRLHAHVLGYLQNSYLVDHTVEYLSPNFHRPESQLFLVVLLGVMLALTRCRQRLRLTTLVVLITTIAFALYSVRNIPLFAVTGLPLLAVHLDTEWRALSSAFVRRARSAIALGHSQGSTWPWVVLCTLVLAGVALNGGALLGTPVTPVGFSERAFPVHAVNRARAAGLSGRMYNEFVWGGYLLYAWPEQKVFIDGQTDFYGADLTRTYNAIRSLDPGWRDSLDTWQISMVIVPATSRLAAELPSRPEWRVWYRDTTATIITRDHVGSTRERR